LAVNGKLAEIGVGIAVGVGIQDLGQILGEDEDDVVVGAEQGLAEIPGLVLRVAEVEAVVLVGSQNPAHVPDFIERVDGLAARVGPLDRYPHSSAFAQAPAVGQKVEIFGETAVIPAAPVIEGHGVILGRRGHGQILAAQQGRLGEKIDGVADGEPVGVGHQAAVGFPQMDPQGGFAVNAPGYARRRVPPFNDISLGGAEITCLGFEPGRGQGQRGRQDHAPQQSTHDSPPSGSDALLNSFLGYDSFMLS